MKRILAWPLCILLLSGCASTLPVPQWESTRGPGALNVSTIYIDEHDTRHLLAGLISGDVFVSRDEGMQWKKLATIHANTPIRRFVQFSHDAGRFFALTDSGLFISTDSCAHWLERTIDGSSLHMRSRTLAIDPYNDRAMYVGTTGHGLYKTTDGGNSWMQCNGGLDSLLPASDVFDIKIDPSKPDNIYSVIRGIGVVKSADGGTSWTQLAAILGSGGVVPTSIVVHPRTPGTLCFGMEAGTIYKTVDDGKTWSPTRLGTGGDNPVALVADPDHPENIYAGTESGPLFSSDFGTSWKSIDDGLPQVTTTVVVSPELQHPSLFVCGEGIGVVWSTDNGTTWSPRQGGLGGSTVSALAADERGTVLYAVVGSSVHRWSTATGAWTSASNDLNGGPLSSITVGADSAAIVHVAAATGTFSTRDSGRTWTTGQHRLRGQHVSFISAHPVLATRVLANAEDQIFVSTDKGETWSPGKPATLRHRIRSFTYSPNDAGFVLGTTSTGGVIKSSDGGISWEESSYGLPPGDPVLVTLDDRTRETLYAWTSRGDGYRTTNKGLTWDHYSPPWQKGKELSIACDRSHPSEVIAMQDSDHLYYSASGGGTWFSIPVEPPPGSVTATCWDSETATFFVGIRDKGVYRLPLSETLRRILTD